MKLLTKAILGVPSMFGGSMRAVPTAKFEGPIYTDPYYSGDLYPALTTQAAMNLSAVWGCVQLRAETVGSLPANLYDKNREVASNNPLNRLLHDSPNKDQTPIEYWGMQTALVDMNGNSMSLIHRRRDKSVISLEPFNENELLPVVKDGEIEWQYNGEKFSDDRIFHLKGFSNNDKFGLSRLHYGRNVFGAQIAAEDAAARTFKGGLKIGGFFKWAGASELTEAQRVSIQARLSDYSDPKNAGNWMMLLKGMEPVAGSTDLRIKPAEAELLASRGFGIEQVCRLFGVPPQLIGQTDKASSWASSIENINLFFLQYSLHPTLVRYQQQCWRKLLTPEDRAAGRYVKFNVRALMSTDTKTRILSYANGLDRGYYNVNTVRDWEDLPPREGGDEYRVALNTGSATNQEKEDGDGKADA